MRNKMQSKKNGSTNIQQKTSGNTKNKCLCGILHSFTTNKLSSKHFSLQRFLFHLRIIACSSHFVWHMTVCIICASCDKLSKISFCVALKAFDTFYNNTTSWKWPNKCKGWKNIILLHKIGGKFVYEDMQYFRIAWCRI